MQYNSIIEEIFSIITQEDARQARDIELIASENFVSDNSAKNYYNELKEKAILLSTDDIKKMLEK